MPIESNHTNPGTTVVVQSDLGDFSLDLAEVERAQKMVERGKRKPDTRDPFTVVIEEFLGGHGIPYTKYWNQNLGRLLKLFSEQHFAENGWNIVEEFRLQEERKISPVYKVVKIPDEDDQQYLHTGIRLMEHSDGTRMVVASSTDDDGDERISVYTTKKISDEDGFNPYISRFSPDKTMFGFKVLEDLEADFFVRGPLKGRFFDLDYRFIKKDPQVGASSLGTRCQKELKRNVWTSTGHPEASGLGFEFFSWHHPCWTSRDGEDDDWEVVGFVTGMTSILVSAEMIRSRGASNPCTSVPANSLRP